MHPRERAICALELEEPDRVPMFELEFQYPEEIVGKKYIITTEHDNWTKKVFREASMIEPQKRFDVTKYNTSLLVKICRKMGYDIVRAVFVPDKIKAIALLKKIAPNHLIAGSTVGTLGIPEGKNASDIIYEIYRKPSEFKRKMDETINTSIESIKAQVDAGADIIFDCTDYCLKEGPFYPLWVYRDLIFPYLKKLVEAAHSKGAYYLKHTDGNIWPIMDGLVATGIDALHSIDPSAGMKLVEVKQRYGDKIAICGNVDAATTMAYGTPEQVANEARQCIRDAAPGGGYFLTTSNCIYKGIPPANAKILSETGQKYGRYSIH